MAEGGFMSDGPQRLSTYSLLAHFAEWAILPAIYLYFAGFLYTYYYFKEFGLSIYRVEVPFYAYLVYSFTVLWQFWWLSLLLATFFLAPLAFRKHWNQTFLLVVLLAIFPLLYLLAKSSGETRAVQVRSGRLGHRVRFVLRDPSKPFTERFRASNEKGKLTLLLETADRVYVLDQDRPRNEELPRAAVIAVPRGEILLQSVTIQSTRNPEYSR
jgi:hypothetical protein